MCNEKGFFKKTRGMEGVSEEGAERERPRERELRIDMLSTA